MASPATAEEMLPVAVDHLASAFVLEKTAAPLEVGTQVTVIGVNDKGIPKPLDIQGTVLGGSLVVFVEFTQSEAIKLAKARETFKLRLRKSAEADPLMVADRRTLAEQNRPVSVARYHHSITITVENSDVAKLDIGDDLVVETGERAFVAQFIAAKQIAGARHDVKIVVNSHYVLDRVLAAEAEGALVIKAAEDSLGHLRDGRRRCLITHRKGGIVQEIQIPCPKD